MFFFPKCINLSHSLCNTNTVLRVPLQYLWMLQWLNITSSTNKQEKGVFPISQPFHTYIIERFRALQANSKTLKGWLDKLLSITSLQQISHLFWGGFPGSLSRLQQCKDLYWGKGWYWIYTNKTFSCVWSRPLFSALLHLWLMQCGWISSSILTRHYSPSPVCP